MSGFLWKDTVFGQSKLIIIYAFLLQSLGNSLLAACEDGKVYKYCMKTGELLGRFVGHRAAVTCFAVIKGSPHGLEYEQLMYTGCLDATFRCCNVDVSFFSHFGICKSDFVLFF